MTPPPNGSDANKPDDDPLGGVDPMAWLESLARRQGADPAELVTGGTLDLPPENADDTIPITPVASSATTSPIGGIGTDDDLSAMLDGADPMSWLESLAKRQGADPAELVTGGMMELPPEEGEKLEDLGEASLRDIFGSAVDSLNFTPADFSEPAVADDPLGGADPMAWLESLARRQGADPAELVTGGTMDLPPEAETVIPAADLTPEPTAAPMGSSTGGTTGITSDAELDDLLGGEDPMKWLERLAANQGAAMNELVTMKTDIPAPSDVQGDVLVPPPAAPEPITPAASLTPEPRASIGSGGTTGITADAELTDLLGGEDPMKWLERLAANQGANTDELVTMRGTQEAPLTPEPTHSEPPLTPMEPEPIMPAASLTPEPMASTSSGGTTGITADAELTDLLGGEDPMQWLERLAAQQGANADELVTMNVVAQEFRRPPPEPAPIETPSQPEPLTPEPMMAMDAVPEAAPAADLTFDLDALLSGLASPLEGMDATGDSGGTMPDFAPMPDLDFGSDVAAESTEAVTMGDALAGSDTLQWLESLTSGAGGFESSLETEAAPPSDTALMDADSVLSWLQSVSEGDDAPVLPTAAVEPDYTPRFTPVEMPPAEPTISMEGGMSDDPAEVLKWLERQTQRLEEIREDFENMPIPGDDSPAVPGEIPSWLAGNISVTETDAALPSVTALSDDVALPTIGTDFPSWLTEPIAEEGSLTDLMAALGDTAPPVEETPRLTIESTPISDVELARLTQPGSPDEIDSWAEAFDDEERRRMGMEEEVPDWYREAMLRVDQERPRDVPPIAAGEMPWWLEVPPQEDVLPAVPDEAGIPAWLTQMASGLDDAPVARPAAPTPEPDFEALKSFDMTDDMAAELAAALTPERVESPLPVQPPPAPTAAPIVTRTPEPPRPVQPPPPPERRIPAITPFVLSEARELAGTGQIAPALEKYQALVDHAESLEDVRADLRTIAQQNPKEPKVFRLLGDTHMRLGDLQAALDTYLNALNQL